MTSRELASVGSIAAVGVFALAAIMLSSPGLRAHDDDHGDHDGDSNARRGLALAPVPLNLHRKNKELVGEGSYIVNVFECNGCHSAGPQNQYTPTGNPYTLSPPFVKEETNPLTYLGGGRVFVLAGVNIISRNLTPDKSGLPIGGDTFQEFRNTIRTGVDPDNLHPALPAPFNGALLQIMPWPALRHLTEHDLRAIYEYLSAIPCVPSTGHLCF